MAEEGNYQEEERGINRRNFLKSAGVVVTGSTLAAGLTLAPESVKAAEAIEAVPDHSDSIPLSHLRPRTSPLMRN